MSDVPACESSRDGCFCPAQWTLAEMLPMLALLRESLDKVPRGAALGFVRGQPPGQRGSG